jgi:hypothetical protein
MWRALNRLLAIVNLPNTVVGAGPPAAKRKTCSSSGDIRYLFPIDGTTFGDRCLRIGCEQFDPIIRTAPLPDRFRAPCVVPLSESGSRLIRGFAHAGT